MLFRREQRKGKLCWFHGIWPGMDFKTRSVMHLPPSKQSDLSLLQSVKAKPWDRTGTKAETDAFILPANAPEEASKPALDPSFGVDTPDPSNLPMPSTEALFCMLCTTKELCLPRPRVLSFSRTLVDSPSC